MGFLKTAGVFLLAGGTTLGLLHLTKKGGLIEEARVPTRAIATGVAVGGGTYIVGNWTGAWG
jgi:hypothetical protein